MKVIVQEADFDAGAEARALSQANPGVGAVATGADGTRLLHLRDGSAAGLDGNGWAYDAALSDPAFAWNDVSVTVTPGTATLVSANGQNIAVTGNATRQDVTVTGSGSYKADQFTTATTSVHLTGSGSVLVLV